MKHKLVFIIIATLSWGAQAGGTNIIVRARYVEAESHFRKVNGQLYNTKLSTLWDEYKVRCVKVETNGIVVQKFTKERIYQTGTGSRPIHNYWGGVKGYRNVTTHNWVGTKDVPGSKFFLLNYGGENTSVTGEDMTFRAMRVGTVNYGEETLALLDCGIRSGGWIIWTNSSR